jgi:ribosomal protein S18 acetylase RimI-like enzyme
MGKHSFLRHGATKQSFFLLQTPLLSDIICLVQMIIEKANKDDLRDILALQKLAYKSEAELYDDHSIPPLTQTIESIEGDFSSHLFLKATISERIIGSVRAYMNHSTCYVGRLIVHPDLQNQGIGGKLLKAIECHFSGAKRFELFTGHRSKRNIHLYEKNGYREFRREQASKNIIMVFMEKIA